MLLPIANNIGAPVVALEEQVLRGRLAQVELGAHRREGALDGHLAPVNAGACLLVKVPEQHFVSIRPDQVNLDARDVEHLFLVVGSRVPVELFSGDRDRRVNVGSQRMFCRRPRQGQGQVSPHSPRHHS